MTLNGRRGWCPCVLRAWCDTGNGRSSSPRLSGCACAFGDAPPRSGRRFRTGTVAAVAPDRSRSGICAGRRRHPAPDRPPLTWPCQAPQRSMDVVELPEKGLQTGLAQSPKRSSGWGGLTDARRGRSGRAVERLQPGRAVRAEHLLDQTQAGGRLDRAGDRRLSSIAGSRRQTGRPTSRSPGPGSRSRRGRRAPRSRCWRSIARRRRLVHAADEEVPVGAMSANGRRRWSTLPVAERQPDLGGRWIARRCVMPTEPWTERRVHVDHPGFTGVVLPQSAWTHTRLSAVATGAACKSALLCSLKASTCQAQLSQGAAGVPPVQLAVWSVS